jgi:hypothetical protein
MRRSSRIQIVRLTEVRSVSQWLRSLGQCPKSISEDIRGGGQYFIAIVQGNPAVLGYCEPSDGAMFFNVDPIFLGEGVASMMLAFLEERLATAISRQVVKMV